MLLSFHSALLSYPRAWSKITANSNAHTHSYPVYMSTHTHSDTQTTQFRKLLPGVENVKESFPCHVNDDRQHCTATVLCVVRHYSWRGWLGFDRVVHVDPREASLEVDLGETCIGNGLHVVLKCIRRARVRCCSTWYHLVAKQRTTISQK